MTDTSKSINNPKYKIDLSLNKYKSRYERLLNILFYSKELPTDLYTQMNMTNINFKKTISILNQRGIVKCIYTSDTKGYILTTKGKQLTRYHQYKKYRNCLDSERRQYDLPHRQRKRQFAYLYALLDRTGITYEDFLKPSIDKVIISDNNVYFYRALDFKRMLGIDATIFNGSKSLGFFIGRRKIVPVYRTNQLLRSFAISEAKVPEYIKKIFKIPVNEAVLICESDKAAADITNQLLQRSNIITSSKINMVKYKFFYVFPSDDSFLSYYNDLYADHSRTIQAIIEQYSIDTSTRDNRGNFRMLCGTGFIENDPVLVYPGNIDIVRLKKYIRTVEREYNRGYIICKERDHEYIKVITQNTSIRIITI